MIPPLSIRPQYWGPLRGLSEHPCGQFQMQYLCRSRHHTLLSLRHFRHSQGVKLAPDHSLETLQDQQQQQAAAEVALDFAVQTAETGQLPEPVVHRPFSSVVRRRSQDPEA